MIKRFINSKFKKDLSFSYISQLLTVSFGFLQLFLINRYYGVETFGQLAIIISTAGIFSSLLTARSSEAVTRFFKREELNRNYENAKFVLFIGFTIDFITAIFLIALIYGVSSFIATIFLKDINLQDDIIVYSFITFFSFLRGSMTGYMQSKEMFVKINIITIIESFSKIVFLLIFIFILNRLSLLNIIYVFLIASILSFLYTSSIFFQSYMKEYKKTMFKFNKSILSEYWHFNIKTFLSSSLKAGNQNIDNLIIGYFLNAQTVGVYQIIKKILSPVAIVASPFSMLVYPKLIHYFETNQRDAFKNIIVKVSFYLLMIALAYSVVSSFFLEYIFNVMNIIFIDEYNFYFVLLSILTILGSQMWWVRAFSNTVNPNYSLYMNLFATFYQLSITIFISKHYGLTGMLLSIIVMHSLILGFWLKKGHNYVYST